MHRSAAQVRQDFIDFFVQRCGHTVVPSSPVVPLDDPTLLFTNAGMNQFKPYFLGTQSPAWRRVANTQKCIRAGGKHNDLDDVGHDTYHHTFFEMLGNWSFGDYFKKEAIEWAWELLTQVWGIDATRLHATYFGGDEHEGLEPDLESRDLWLAVMKRHGLDADHVHAGSKKDNFWEMGDTGPCGPCSEIHIDLTPDKRGAALVNKGDARVMEIWNLVFIQFNRGPDGKLTPLPARHVDTGMGFERVTAVLQGHHNNYATDVFVPIIQAIERISGHQYGGRPVTEVGSLERENHYARFSAGDMRDEACRVIADHIRCLTFAITDGALPDKEGRGYVLRRILRRAVRFGWQYLNLHKPFLCDLVDTVVATMGDAFPELRQNPQQVRQVIRDEEESFDATLERGIRLFDGAAAVAEVESRPEGWMDAPGIHVPTIPGEVAFRLHDTFGFPIDLTQVMAQEKGLTVDIGEYQRLMEEARERARAGSRIGESHLGAIPGALLAKLALTDDSPKYSTLELTTDAPSVLRFKKDGTVELVQAPDALLKGESGALVLEETCFYAEQGGQVGDRGLLLEEDSQEEWKSIFAVENTVRVGDKILHLGNVQVGAFADGETVRVQVDPQRRATMKNHTVTHVLNWALRQVLDPEGKHLQQKGSLVDPEKTRFDFSHPRPMTPEEILRVEMLVNEQIARDLPVYIEEIPQQEALRINGLRAVFGERYPDVVRTMCIGVPIDELLRNPHNPEWRKYSVEFCGGTHVRRTSEIEHFVLASEEAVAKGVRRIVGLTGETAWNVEQEGASLVRRAEALRAGPPAAVPAGLTELQNTLATATIAVRHRLQLRELIPELQRIAKEEQKVGAADASDRVNQWVDQLLCKQAEKIGQTVVLVAETPPELDDAPIEAFKSAADRIKQKYQSAAVIFGRRLGDRAVLLAATTTDAHVYNLTAGEIVKQIAPIVGGGGGGPPGMAQAGGKDSSKLPEALHAGQALLRARLPK